MATNKQEFESIEGQSPDILRRADGAIVRVVPIAEPTKPKPPPASPAPAAAPPPAAATGAAPAPAAPDHLAVWDRLRASDALAATRYLEAHPSIYRAIEQRRRGAASR